MMLFSAGGLLFFGGMAQEGFADLGFPGHVTWILGILKILGVAAIWSRVSKPLVEWAYAGFFFVFFLAFSAPLNVGDGDWGRALLAVILLFISYFFYKKIDSGSGDGSI